MAFIFLSASICVHRRFIYFFPRKKGDDPRFGAQVVAKSGDGVHRMAE
jgi:hypothetical protein